MIPSFFRDADPSGLYIERADVVTREARAHRTAPSRDDREKVAAFGIDAQVAFCTPGASLFVPGAPDDNARALRFLYGNLERITTLALSLDTHRVFQIFHPAWWQNEAGQPPAPLTAITHADVASGKWRATRSPEQSEAYVRKLEEGGRYVLTIWPYHAMLGGLSHALVPAMMELSMFHSIARDTQTVLVQKGGEPLTESYSVLSPEVGGSFNEDLFRLLMHHDRVYVFGQAKSHCVLSTLRDLMARIEKEDRGLAKKVHVLVDAMSPVPAPPLDPLPKGLDFPAIAEEGLRDLQSKGMRLVRTTDGM